MVSQLHVQIQENGFTILHGVFGQASINKWIERLDKVFETQPETIKNRQGAVYAARNILSLIPECRNLALNPVLNELLTETLGPNFGVVRGLYFDKHPNQSWTLPWHKDLTIAVKDNSLRTSQFSKPTTKNGVPHVESSAEVLSQMLTLRIHLDRVTEENGPLEVAIGSHLSGKEVSDNHRPTKILADAGDVLAMRPMISHASGSSSSGTKMHRRILHLEFAANRNLPDGFEWFQFLQPGG